ncbi:MAG: hypothetical protein II596_07925, partial [Thermoguttaceae bacterium]|nr:hypothetical protein [Thermoguttaceae bacterium]
EFFWREFLIKIMRFFDEILVKIALILKEFVLFFRQNKRNFMKNRVFFIGKFATINRKAKDFSFDFGRFSVKRASVFSRKRRF